MGSKKAIENGCVSDYLNYVEVKKGDVIDIPAGLVHAITSGLLIVEIQQNSDTTFRVYDYDRVDSKGCKRELHIERALDVIDFSNDKGSALVVGEESKKDEVCIREYINNDYFEVKKYETKSAYYDKSLFNSFTILTIVKGNGIIKFKDDEMKLDIGDTIFIPAYLGEYEIIGEIALLKCIPKK